jgi:hypothetical protein
MSYNEFQRPISVDFVPCGRVCEWCGQPAERQLTAIGGIYHNRSGVFCDQCGEQFLENVRRGLLMEKQEYNTRVCSLC